MIFENNYEEIDLTFVCINRDISLRDALTKLNDNGIGILCLVEDENRFIQTLTDGDLRRYLLSGKSLDSKLHDLPFNQSITISNNQSESDARALFELHAINHLPLLSDDGKIITVFLRHKLDEKIGLSIPHMGIEELEFVQQAFDSNWIAPLGPNVSAFEEEIAEKVGINSVAALSSGTAAIHLGLRLLDIKPNDKVFVSSLTFVASVNPVLYEFAEPIFIDSEFMTWNMCPKALLRAFEQAKSEGWMPRCVIVVHLYGLNAQMDKIKEICDHYNVPILEDAAESLGGFYKGKASGTLGRIGAYSFNGNKIITTSGGGALISDDVELVEKARYLSTQAREVAPYYEHREVGYNYRMSNILAGVGRGQLRVLEKRVKARRQVFDNYVAGLTECSPLSFLQETDDNYTNRWLTVASISKDVSIDAKTVIETLASQNIEARHVWKPMHIQPLFKGAQFVKVENKSVAGQLFETGICLPSSSNMNASSQNRVIDSIHKIFNA